MNYIQGLIPRTETALNRALKKFPTQADIFPFCLHVVADMTPYLCQVLREDLRLHEMRKLVEDLLFFNCPGSAVRFQLMQELRSSAEWQALAERSTIEPLSAKSETPDEAPAPEAEIAVYMAMVSTKERKIVNADFALVAGCSVRSLQVYTQGNATPRMQARIHPVLKMSKDVFWQRLHEKERPGRKPSR
jgi:hypothetical protein